MVRANNFVYVTDPIKLSKILWPHVEFFDKQWEIIYSVVENDLTVVPAGNMLGKDFVSGFIAVYSFLVNPEARIITTSVKDDHLRVLWGEIGRFVQSSRFPLLKDQGGPLIFNHRDIRKIVRGQECKISYLRGMVSEKGEGMAGHHAAFTLGIIDEASGVDDMVYTQMDTWARRILLIGNCNPCENFFKTAVKGKRGTKDHGGDRPRSGGVGYYRKVIKVRAQDSPNVKLGLAEQRAGKKPTNRMIIPGVLQWTDYVKRRLTWDKVRQCIGLDAEFWEGADALMFPPDWLNHAETLANQLRKHFGNKRRQARAIGVDPAEGGDKTAMAAVDEYGLIELVSKSTPDTNVIPREALDFARRHGVEPEFIVFDRGGGGKQHADRLRASGHNVRTVAFGEAISIEPQHGVIQVEARLENREERYVYRNRRAEMYGTLRMLLDPNTPGTAFALTGYQPSPADYTGFALPGEYEELRIQLSPIPMLWDAEGRLKLPPKNKRSPNSEEVSLTELIGCSPDEADALVLAIHGMTHVVEDVEAGALM
jgi:hypothetical protein